MAPTPTAAASVAFMIGHPVGHTALPERVNAWALETGFNALMAPLDVPPAALPGCIALLRTLGNCSGAVITAPHKQATAQLVDALTPAARLVGAANVVLRGPDGQLTGDNTDGAGFVAALEENGAAPSGASGIVFGCGGAGASIVAALAESGTARLDIVDIDPQRAVSLATRISSPARAIAVPESLGDYDLVVNATAIGLDGKSMVHPLTGLRPDALVADVVSKPARTPLLKKADEMGARTQTGAAMAVAQVPLVIRRFGWMTQTDDMQI